MTTYITPNTLTGELRRQRTLDVNIYDNDTDVHGTITERRTVGSNFQIWVEIGDLGELVLQWRAGLNDLWEVIGGQAAKRARVAPGDMMIIEAD
jgi:hypothetical protein